VHGLSVQNNQGPNASGQRTPSTIQPLFCKENYEKHNSNQHPIEWEKYKKANKE
jgi:hypothetical protein